MTASVLLEILLKTESHNLTGCREYNKKRNYLNLFNRLQNLPSLFPMPVAPSDSYKTYKDFAYIWASLGLPDLTDLKTRPQLYLFLDLYVRQKIIENQVKKPLKRLQSTIF